MAVCALPTIYQNFVDAWCPTSQAPRKLGAHQWACAADGRGQSALQVLGLRGAPRASEGSEIDEKYQKVGKSTQLVGGLEHVFHRLGIIIPID